MGAIPTRQLGRSSRSYRSGGGGNEAVGAFETHVSLWRCSEQATACDASMVPEGAAAAAPAKPKAAVAIAPAAITGKVKAFIVLPFEKADGSFLTAVCQCPSFVAAVVSDGFRISIGALTEFGGRLLFAVSEPSTGGGPATPSRFVLRDQKQYCAGLLVTGSRRQRQIDLQREGAIERLIQHVGRNAHQRACARRQLATTPSLVVVIRDEPREPSSNSDSASTVSAVRSHPSTGCSCGSSERSG